MTKDMTQNSMSDKKQSSVEWLSEQTYNAFNLMHQGYITMAEFRFKMLHYGQQAKAMHKEEIKDAYNQGYRDGEMTTDSSRSQVDISEFNDADIYFENTFGGNNEQQ